MSQRYPHYKPTGSAWLGNVPSHWNLERLGLHFNERRTKVSDKDYQPLSVTKNGIVPQLDTAAKTDDGDNRKLVKSGDFVVNGRSDRKGSSGLSKLDGSVSLINIVLQPAKSVHPEFCHYLLRSTAFQEEFYRMGNGLVADLWTTHFSDMKNIQLALPPIEEQRQITGLLTYETSRIDSLIEKKTRFIELLKEKRQAVITKAVTKGLDQSVSLTDSRVDWIGQVPAHWKIKRLKHNLKLITEKADKRTFAIALEHIESWSGRLIINESEFDGDGTIFRKGDILFGKLRPYLAKVYLSDSSGEAVGDIWVLRPIGEHHPKFLQYQLLNREFITTVNASTTGAKMPRADWDYVGSLPAPTPPLNEQVSIANFLDRLTTRIDQLIEKTQVSIELLNEHRAALITAAVTGKIDVRNPK